MEVNNRIYDDLGHLWWDDQAGFDITSLRFCMNPVRYGYFRRQLQAVAAPGEAVLDVGCGGGFLAEAFAEDGYDVTGVDPSANSIVAARAHATVSQLAIDYRVGRGECLPFPDSSFDIVCCCDVLEHVDEPSQVVREISRTLKAGGVFFYDTVNRTPMSWILLIKLWQDWHVAGFSAPNVHVWRKFIKPDELDALMHEAQLSPRERRGITTGRNPAALVPVLRRIRTGQLKGPAIATEFTLRETEDLTVSYIGFAVKQSA
ncbi:bifunctional 2-polyprenyl-6-hydroxyphenol methylase/3-demethylubiquinol 3-O-methyltransferase UbiG [uncultured Paludibaculum sp.]|uniref:bifunctional 2-polyprenyl-6-hydroxyphenol methylase/3-demethylubiquinol 3-O-methyltransferase UbiG n=1 Tax=uncultured Paludibaculum sp. TaxID=1765020 RepID=UPI002AAB2DF3|nr:bifunctional 2-polyprenyl-6-hydroxyphenol methylase/3-demethylubiquinol 3-O-methyltransferase UbiG [uncultured Paludibaculum sp.]